MVDSKFSQVIRFDTIFNTALKFTRNTYTGEEKIFIISPILGQLYMNSNKQYYNGEIQLSILNPSKCATLRTSRVNVRSLLIFIFKLRTEPRAS